MSAGQASLPRASQAQKGLLRAGYSRAALGVLALLAALPSAPVFNRTPDAVSGAALTAGAEILRGRVLYREIWHNAPPLTAFLNALGLALGGPERWGVWALEVIALLAASLLIYELLRRDFPMLPALFGAAGLLANLVLVYQPGSVADAFALPLQAGAYLVLGGIARDSRSLWRSFVLGILAGLLVSLKLELFGVGLVVGAGLLGMAIFTRSSRYLLHLLLMGLGVLLVGAGWAVLFAAQGAISPLLDQVFRYNFFYSGITNPVRLQALGSALKSLYWASGFFSLGALAWLVTIPYLFFNIPRFREVLFSRWMGAVPLLGGLLLLFNSLWDDRTGGIYDFSALSSYRLGLAAAGLLVAAVSLPFLMGWADRWAHGLSSRFPSSYQSAPLISPLALAFVDLPVQIIFAGLTGQGTGPAFLPVLPALAIMTAFLVWSLQTGQAGSGFRQNAPVWLALLALPVLVTGWFSTAGSLRVSADSPALQAAEELRAITQPDQPILQWGDNAQLYILADRSPTSRFFQQRPLFRPGYASAERVQSFIEDLYVASPVILVDTRSADMPLVLPGVENCEKLQDDAFVEQSVRAERDARYPLRVEEPLPYYPAEMKAVYRWLCENYEPVPTTNTDTDAWRFYRLHPAKP